MPDSGDPSSADTDAGFRYAYDFDDDGTVEIGTSSYGGSSSSDTTTYDAASTARTANAPADATEDDQPPRTVRVRVIDKDGGSNVYTATLTVNNVVPDGDLADVTVAEGATATVGLTNVTDPGEAASVRYAYDFDGDDTDDTNVAYASASTEATAQLPDTLTADGPATHIFRVG